MSVSKLFLALIFLSCTLRVAAQEVWPSPEVEQMYAHARQYMAMGNTDDALTTWKQLLALVPGNTTVATQLGNAYYIKGDYDHALQTLEPAATRPDATDTAYQLLAATQIAQKEKKRALATLARGRERFPASGLLYYQTGKVHLQAGDPLQATKAWLDGTDAHPTCALNYKEAALRLMATNDRMSGLLYAEEYLAMRHDTAGDDALKQQLLQGWKLFFDNITEQGHTNAFEQQSYIDIYTQLTPVVSDGVTTENLTMARTRFLIAWTAQSRQQDTRNGKMMGMPLHFMSPLMEYHDYLVREGWFDIYNEWLFGKAENAAQYAAWMKFHDGDMQRFEEWRRTLYYVPAGQRFYRPRDAQLEQMFAKKKKR